MSAEPTTGSGWVRELAVRPSLFVPGAFLLTVGCLGLDHYLSLGPQMLLALGTWVGLVVVLSVIDPQERAQTILVMAVATCAEVIGSIIWGVYEYRLGNLPLFVPPGHGLVYLTGLRISQSRIVRANPRRFVGLVLCLAAGWGILGLTAALGRLDVAGAVGTTIFCVFLVKGRAPTIYAGVFCAVGFLEIYGTAIGTWRWAEEIPGLAWPDGNPPSGAVCGYVLFDIAALALAPTLMAASAAVARWWRRRTEPEPPPTPLPDTL